MVEVFIREFKQAVVKGKWQFVRRRKNIEFLTEIGWTETIAVEYLAEKLLPKHYVKGPEDERDPKFEPGLVYIFKMAIENHEVYIKIKKVSMEEYFVIISFHEDEGD